MIISEGENDEDEEMILAKLALKLIEMHEGQ
jgi:hypothetical protein